MASELSRFIEDELRKQGIEDDEEQRLLSNLRVKPLSVQAAPSSNRAWSTKQKVLLGVGLAVLFGALVALVVSARGHTPTTTGFRGAIADPEAGVEPVVDRSIQAREAARKKAEAARQEEADRKQREAEAAAEAKRKQEEADRAAAEAQKEEERQAAEEKAAAEKKAAEEKAAAEKKAAEEKAAAEKKAAATPAAEKKEGAATKKPSPPPKGGAKPAAKALPEEDMTTEMTDEDLD
ncbi:hypothetical protein ABPG77_004432 [Micractinium sp. CCAP 211/92]